jgi:putative ABC transport system permease protein
MVDAVLLDGRDAWRALRRSPGFSCVVIATVALAIAANTAMFGVVNAVLIRPLPFAGQDRLVQVAEKNDRLHLSAFGASVLNFQAWRERSHAFDSLAALGFINVNLSGSGEPEQFVGNRISPALFKVLGVAPVAGRAFTAEEEQPGAPAVAMIGERLWARRFGGDASLVGRTLVLDGAPVTVVGIAPASLSLFSGGEIFRPLTIDPAKEIRLNHVIFVVARLAPGLTLEQAQAECDTTAAGMAATWPELRDWGIHLLSFRDTFVAPQLRASLLILLAGVMCVLLIACANIANLLLARATSRRREMAVRTALGAPRARLVRQVLVESTALAGIGGAFGILGAMALVRVVNAALPANLLPVPDVPLDGTVLLFAAFSTVATGVLFGLAPAAFASEGRVGDVLKSSRGDTGGGAPLRLRRLLAASELALATVLLIGAGLLVQTFLNLQGARLGFDPQGLLTFQLAPPAAKYPPPDKASQLYRSLLDSLQAAPGVRGAAVSSGLPFGQGNYTTSPLVTSGPSVLPPDTPVPIDWRIVSPGYFAMMGIPLLRGRDLSDADGPQAARVTVVSQETARRFWGDDDPLGRTLKRTADGSTFTVVGVVGEVRSTTLNQENPCVYYPLAARVWPVMDVAVKTDGDPMALLPMVRRKVRDLDAELPLATVRTMDDWVRNSAAQPRLSASLVGAFAGAAVVIAALGIYGVLAFSVNRRTREIGVRIALGARASSVVRLVVREGMSMAALGIGFGVLGALGLGRAVASLVYGVTPADPATFVLVAAGLAAVSLASCWLPARRAARVDPLVALREE